MAIGARTPSIASVGRPACSYKEKPVVKLSTPILRTSDTIITGLASRYVTLPEF